MESLREAVELRCGATHLGWLGHHEPALDEVVAAALRVDPRSVVVPVLLAPAFHARVDVPAGAGQATVARVLAPDERLLDALDDRLAEALSDRPDALVLAAAGSTDAAADELVQSVARSWAMRTQLPVEVGYASATPTVAEAVRALRGRGLSQVAVGSFLLAPGRLHDVVTEAAELSGATAVAGPMGAHPSLVAVLCDRTEAARREAALRG